MCRIRPDSILLYINDAEDYLPPSVWLAACADDTTSYKAILNRESEAADAGVLETAVLPGYLGNLMAYRIQAHEVTGISHLSIVFLGVVVSEVLSSKLLGVKFYRGLTFRDHLRNVFL